MKKVFVAHKNIEIFFFFLAKLVHKTLFEYILHRKYAFLD